MAYIKQPNVISKSHDETLTEQHLGFVNLLFAKGW